MTCDEIQINIFVAVCNTVISDIPYLFRDRNSIQCIIIFNDNFIKKLYRLYNKQTWGHEIGEVVTHFLFIIYGLFNDTFSNLD
jgi:hypothetical protein